MSEPDGNKLVRVDMHCHTRLSKDSLNDPRKLVEIAAARGIHVLCVTDHNGLANALALSKMDGLPTRVIPSEEVKSNEGEIIGYFLSELVPKGLTPEETAKRIRGQGGLVAVPHPFDSLRTASRLRTPALERLVEAGLVDIIEVLNARSIQVEDNARALEFARKHDLAMSAGSDAHLRRSRPGPRRPRRAGTGGVTRECPCGSILPEATPDEARETLQLKARS